MIEYLIKCEGSIDYEREITVPIDEYEEDLERSILDDVMEEVFDEWDDDGIIENLIDDFIWEFHSASKSSFNLLLLYDEMFGFVHHQINKLGESIHALAICKFNNNLLAEYDLVHDYIIPKCHSQLEMREGCEQSCCDAGGYIERALNEFVKNASWKRGLISRDRIITEASEWPTPGTVHGETRWVLDGINYMPALWYGIEGEMPDPKWTISLENLDIIEDFWLAESEEILQHLVDNADGDAFMTWFFLECGCSCPDVKKILEQCPVRFVDGETTEVRVGKMLEYFRICSSGSPR